MISGINEHLHHLHLLRFRLVLKDLLVIDWGDQLKY